MSITTKLILLDSLLQEILGCVTFNILQYFVDYPKRINEAVEIYMQRNIFPKLLLNILLCVRQRG